MSNKQECAFTSVAPYPKVRQLAHGLKDGDYASICRAADMMADGIRGMAAGRNCVLVPIPNHHGRAVYTKTLANEISRRTGIPTWTSFPAARTCHCTTQRRMTLGRRAYT